MKVWNGTAMRVAPSGRRGCSTGARRLARAYCIDHSLPAQGEKMNPIRNSCAGLITAAALTTTLSSAGLAAGTYDINVVLPLTGSAAFVGQGERDALLALADQINATGGIAGDKLNFIFQDDQTQPQLAVRLASTCP